jgi:hypothetical protein
MSGVFRNIDPPTPTPPGECVPPPPPPLVSGGRTHSLGGEGVGGSKVRNMPDTALYSIYVSTLCYAQRTVSKASATFSTIGYLVNYLT